MPRRTFDSLMTAGGVVITIVLVIAGVMTFVGYSYANDNVTTQLAQQKIFFPEKGSDALKDPQVAPFLNKYAGQRLATGAQAEAYANHFIQVHIRDAGKGTDTEGMTYAELGGAQGKIKAQIAALPPTDPAVAGLQARLTAVNAQRETVFKGETLRGLLLNAYAWWKVGQIALWATLAAFGLAVVMAVLTILGFWHLRRVSPTEQILAPVVPEARKIA